MKYVSIDIETTGLDPENNQILSIGAIIEDTAKKLNFEDIPKFNAIVLQRQIVGSARAITMNKGLIELIGEYLEADNETKEKHRKYSGFNFYEPDEVIKEFYYFLYNNYGTIESEYEIPSIIRNTKHILINVAGKNFGTFDQMFLKQLPWWQKIIRVKQRIIDPAILCCDWVKDDELPSLKICKERLGVDGIVAHNALEDAWDVIQILRKFY